MAERYKKKINCNTKGQSSNISNIGLWEYSNFFMKPSVIPIFIYCSARQGKIAVNFYSKDNTAKYQGNLYTIGTTANVVLN